MCLKYVSRPEDQPAAPTYIRLLAGCVYLLAPIKPPSPILSPPWPFETGIVAPLTLLPGYHSSIVVASSSGMGMVVLLCESLCWATKSGRALPEGPPTLGRNNIPFPANRRRRSLFLRNLIGQKEGYASSNVVVCCKRVVDLRAGLRRE